MQTCGGERFGGVAAPGNQLEKQEAAHERIHPLKAD